MLDSVLLLSLVRTALQTRLGEVLPPHRSFQPKSRPLARAAPAAAIKGDLPRSDSRFACLLDDPHHILSQDRIGVWSIWSRLRLPGPRAIEFALPSRSLRRGCPSRRAVPCTKRSRCPRPGSFLFTSSKPQVLDRAALRSTARTRISVLLRVLARAGMWRTFSRRPKQRHQRHSLM
jgi:hypothetical protein